MDNKILSLLLSMLMVSMAAAGCLGGDDDDTTTTDVEGCTDSTATNYDADATVDDGSCTFPPVAGCMDSEASNYDSAAVEDDGSCTYSLTVWHSYALDSTEEEAFNNVIAAFEAANPNYNLDVQYVPFDDLKPQYVTAAQAGSAPDVFRLQNDALGEVAANTVGGVSVIEDLAPYMTPAELAAYGTSMSGVTVNGQILGLPQSGDSLALYYNKDVLDLVGVDYTNISSWTFEDFYGAAVTVSMASDNHWGLCFPYKSAYQFWPWLTGYGGAIFDDQGNPTINSASTVSAIQTIQLALYGQPAGGTGPLPDGSAPSVLKPGCDWGNMEDMFKDGETAFIIQGPWAYGGIEASNVNFGHTVMPLSVLGIPFSPFVGMKGWSVSSSSDAKGASVTLTKYLSGYDSQVEFAKTAKLLPVMPSVLDDDDVKTDSVVAGFGAQMARGFGAPAYAAMGSIWGPVDSMLADVFDNGMAPADAARKAQAAIEKALGMDLTVDDDADDDGFTIDGANADCNDNDATVYPGADDPEGDMVDQNCDGIDGVDVSVTVTLMVHTDDSNITAVHFKGLYNGWVTEAGTQDSADPMMFTIEITTNPGTYEWGAEDQSGNWLGTHCEDLDGTMSDDGTNCEFTVAADGTVSGATKIHLMTSM